MNDRPESADGRPARRGATVEFRRVSKRYLPGARPDAGAPTAVEDLSFTVASGEICVLVGPSGCGKTTTLKMINRLIAPSSGQILIDGQDVARIARCSSAGASATSSSRPVCSRTAPSQRRSRPFPSSWAGRGSGSGPA
jgi:ABC-type glutathione transport system ATPase component